MSRIRDLLMDRIHNPKPIVHLDFSPYDNIDKPTSIPNLAGNDYSLHLVNVDFSLMSGFGGYTDDWTRYNSGDPDKTDHTAEVLNTSGVNCWFWGSNNFQPGETIPAQIVKVSGMDPDASYQLYYNNYSSGTLKFYSDGIYLLPEGTHTGSSPTLGVGLFIYNPNKDWVDHVHAEQLPLYPGCFVASPSDDGKSCPYLISDYLDCTQFNPGKGFTIISQRSVEPLDDYSYLYFSGGGQIQRLFEERLNAGSEESAVISFSKQNVDIPTKYRGIVPFTSTVFNGTHINKGDIVQSDISGFYIGQINRTFKGGIREFYLFNRDLTQSQIERFISENMVPDPLVYYDVRKQNNKNSNGTTRGTLIDLSGNGNHGVLNNFQYSASLIKEYLDSEFPITIGSDNISGDNHIYTVNSDTTVGSSGIWLLSHKVSPEPSGSFTSKNYSVLVTGMTEGQPLQIIPLAYDSSGSTIISNSRVDITHDGVYDIPAVTTELPDDASSVITGIVYCRSNDSNTLSAGLKIEYLPTVTSDSGQYYIDDVFPIENPYGSVTVEDHKINITKDFSAAITGSFMVGSAVDTSEKVLQVPDMRLKITGLVSGELQIGYIEGSFRSQFTITSDGTYFIPGYEVPLPSSDFNNRRAVSFYSYTDSNNVGVNDGVVIELLPVQKDGWVETYIDDEIPLILNDTNKGNSTWGSHILSLKNNSKGWLLIADPLDYDTRVKGFTVKVSGMSENQRITFRNGDNTNFYIISSDGIYEIPPHDAKVGERPIIINCTANSTGTVKFLPRTDYLQFNGTNDTVTIPSLTEGFKTVCMIMEDDIEDYGRLYDQRRDGNPYFSLYSRSSIAYNSSSTGGQTFINGTLNTSLTGKDLRGQKICVVHRNNGVTPENSTTPFIGAVQTSTAFINPMKLSKFLGFHEYLSDTQIKKVIDRYALMEGVNLV